MLKIYEFPKISKKKMKNFIKHFYKSQTAVCLKEIIQPPPDRTFLQAFSFQVLRECSSWASRNGAEQMFFLTPTRNMFLAVMWQYLFYNVE